MFCNDHITTILTCLDTILRFFSKKRCFLEAVKTSYIPPKLSLIHLRKYLISQNKNYIFMIRKNWNFCDQNLQFVATLLKCFKIFNFMFFNFDSSFFQNIFQCNIPLGRGFSTIPNLLNSLKCYSIKFFEIL